MALPHPSPLRGSIIGFNDVMGGVPGHRCKGIVTSLCFYMPFMKVGLGARNTPHHTHTQRPENPFTLALSFTSLSLPSPPVLSVGHTHGSTCIRG